MAEAARARRRARLALAACTGAAAGALGALGAAWWLWGAGAGAARGGSVGAGGGGGGGGAGAPPAGAGGGAGGGGGGGLEAHFAFVRAVADGTTAPALLPGLRARVHALADVGALTAELQAGGLGPAEKLRVWGALKECAFVRSLGGMWGGVLLVVLCRVQLCILGRHMYVESRMEEEAAGGGGGLGAPSLDPNLQQAFLACAEGFCHRGAGLVVDRMERAARGTVGHIGLDGTFRLPEAIGALAFLSATFEADAAARGWTELLVPRPEEEAADGAGAAAGGGVGAGAGAGAGGIGGRVAAMVDELRAITGTPAFAAAVRAATQIAAQQVSAGVADSFRGEPELPFAKVVPAVARAAQGLFSDPEAFVQGVVGTPEMERLCAEVFSTIPEPSARAQPAAY